MVTHCREKCNTVIPHKYESMKQFSLTKYSCVFWFSQFKSIIFLGLLNPNILSPFILYFLKFTSNKLLQFKRSLNLSWLHMGRHLRYRFQGLKCTPFNFISHNSISFLLLAGFHFFVDRLSSQFCV